MTTRRGVLKLIGGGTILAAGGAGGFIAANGPSQSARAPWREAGGYEEYRRRALSYALLAPNPHNLQPWRVALEDDDALTLYCDLDRRLPATDPFDRQITIGCGAFLELLKIAAAEDGYAADIDAFPDGGDMTTLDGRPVAHVRFRPAAVQRDPLFAQILNRRSNKTVYADKDVPPELLSELADAGRVYGARLDASGDPELAATLQDLTWRAHKVETFTRDAYQESIDVMRIGRREVAANPDGIELDGAMMEAARLMGVMTREKLADPNSTGFKQGLKMYQDMAMSGRAFAWLTNADNSRLDQINAGRAYVRFNLKATELGLAIHPWSQSLQEYPEMSDLYDEVHGLIGGGERLQMLVRVGYAGDVGPTPRRGLEAHLI